jgi:hypothetical protein
MVVLSPTSHIVLFYTTIYDTIKFVERVVPEYLSRIMQIVFYRVLDVQVTM